MLSAAATACYILLSLISISIASISRGVARDQPPSNACALSCTGVHSEAHYEVGRSYIFDVNSRSILKFANKNQAQSSEDVIQTAQAYISVHSPCEFTLKLSATSLRGIDVGQDWSSNLERYPLRFAFDDGKVEAICPHQNDPVWAVNIKRAILSAFQINHDSDRETDITGDCPVYVEKQKSGAMLNLKTTKNITECNAVNGFHGIRVVLYQLRSKMQESPVAEFSQKCDRQVGNQNLQKVTCAENFRLLTIDDNFLSLHVDQSMTAAGTGRADQLSSDSVQHQSIQFDHSEDHLYARGSTLIARSILDELCRESNRVNENAASEFLNLVYNLRGLSHQEIASIARSNCNAFADALAACATPDCLTQLSTLINSGVVDESIYWSLALSSRPKAAIIDSIATFINQVPLDALLPVTSLVQAYCIAHPDCGSQQSVVRIIQSVLSKLPSGCQTSDRFDEIKKIVLLLKSLGNIGGEKQSLHTIFDCIGDANRPIQVRLAAIDALRRKPCVTSRTQKLSHLFKDQQENIEVRIGAFRQLMQCPDISTIEMIANHMQNETINQVGSYVWSYLNTKEHSSNPGSYSLRNTLKQFHLPARFNMDPSRFSRFFELGYFDKQKNIGGHMDTSLIFTPKGYIPRQATFNFTLHIYGKSINVLEVGGQAEGLEQAENELFGADGFITNPNSYVFREKSFRSHYDKVNQLKNLFNRKNSVADNHLQASFYTRMFGDDLHYCGFERNNFLEDVKASVDLEKILTRLAKPKDFKFARNMLLFELSQTFPTLAGIPLQIAQNMSLAVKVEHKMKLNFVELLKQRANADGFIKLNPSVSVSREVKACLRAGSVLSGMMMKSNGYVAAGIERQLELQQGRRFSVKIDVPHNEPFVAKISNALIKLNSNRHQRVQNLPRRQPREAFDRHYCSSETLSKILGVQACIEAQVLFPSFHAEVKLKKTDPGLKFYQLLVERSSDNNERKLLMSLDTPGSHVNRKMEGDFELSFAHKKLRLAMTTPFKKIAIDGALTERRRLEDYDAKLKLVVDDRKEYSMDGTLKATKDADRTKYNLNANTASGSAAAAAVTAQVQYSTARPFASIDFQLDKVFNKPIIFKSLLNPAAPKYDAKLEYSGLEFSGKLDATAVHSGLFNLRGAIEGEYQVGNRPKKTAGVGFEQSFQKKKSGHNFKHVSHLTVPGLQPMNFQIISDRNTNQLNNLIEATYLGERSYAKLDATRAPNDIYNAVAEAKYLLLGVDAKANIAYQNRFPKQFMFKIDAETPTTKGVHASVQYAMMVDPKWNLNGNARFAYPGREISFNNKIDEMRSGRYKMVSSAQWDARSQIDANSNVICSPEEHEYGIESTARFTGMQEPIYIKQHVHYEPENYKAHLLARHGNQIIYEMIGDVQGKIGNAQKINIEAKSEKLEPKINYQMTANIMPSAEAVSAETTVKKDGRDFGRGKVIFPRKIAAPERKFFGEFDWNYRNQPHKAMFELLSRKDERGCNHHVTLKSDNNVDLQMELDQHDQVHLKCDLVKDRVKIISGEVSGTPFRWNHFEMQGHLDTDRPLQKKSFKSKTMFNYDRDQASMEARFEADGQRYLLDGQWRKQMSVSNQRHYTYSGKLETPESRLHLDQQLQIESPFILRKGQTNLELTGGRQRYKLNNEVSWDGRSLNGKTEIDRNGALFKHTIDYAHQSGQRNLKNHITLDGKEADINLDTIYRSGEVKVDFDLKSTFDTLSKLKGAFDCRQGSISWNCKVEGNANDHYVIKGHETFEPHLTDIGYLVKLSNLVNNEGKLMFSADERARKYQAKALLLKSDQKFVFDLDVTGDHGTIQLHTPTQAITNAQVTMTRKGPHEFELNSQQSGALRGKVHATIRNNDNNKLFTLTVSEIADPFELQVEHSMSSGKQVSKAIFTSDSLGHKQSYGVENKLEYEGGDFRAIRSTLIHPKRQMLVELLRPTRDKYVLSMQPQLGSNRAPTTAELTKSRTADTYNVQISVSDPAIRRPVVTKFSVKTLGNDANNYGVDILTTFDYSGQPEKLVTNLLHIQRSISPPAPGTNGDVHFVAEFKRTQPASNLYMHAWAKVNRRLVQLKDGQQSNRRLHRDTSKQVLIPVETHFGFETRNAQRQPVEFSLNTESDAQKFAKFSLKLPASAMKIRMDRVSSGHYILKFYKDSDRALLVGDLAVRKRDVELELRNDQTSEVKLHASIQMPDDYALRVKLWHSNQKKKVRDAEFSLEIKEDNLLKSNVYIRPAVENDIMQQVKETLSKGLTLSDHSLYRDTIVPISHAKNALTKDLMATFDEAIKTWTKEQRDLASDIGPMYAKMFDELEGNFETVCEGVLHLYDQGSQAAEGFAKSLPRGSSMTHYLSQLHRSAEQIPSQVISVLRPITELFEVIAKQIKQLQQNAANSLDYVEKNLKIDQLKAALNEYRNEFSRMDVIQTALLNARKLTRKYQMPDLERKIARIEYNRQGYSSQAVQLYNQVKDVVLDNLIVSVLSSLTDTILYPLDDIEIQKNWRIIMKYLRGKTATNQLASKFWRQYIPQIKRVGPGEYTMEMTVPHGASSLTELLTDLHPHHFNALKSAIAETFGIDGQKLPSGLDSIYTYKARQLNFWDPFKSFQSVAYVIDGDWFVSFDGRIFNFHAPCEYLLAADFVNQQFALIAKFTPGGQLDAIKAELRGEQVVLHKNGNVEVNNAAVSLPWQNVDSMDDAALIAINRIDYWTVLTTYDGLRIRCSSERDFCEIRLPVRMHGRSNGLLGTNDNEPANEHELVDGTSNQHLDVLAEHWALTGGCRQNHARPMAQHSNEHCQSYFKSLSSALRPCFSTVHSNAFDLMCSNAKDGGRAENGPKGPCSTAAAYLQICKSVGVSVELPDDCATCANGMAKGESRKVTQPSNDYDVVFVVEERVCMEHFKSKVFSVAQQIRHGQGSVRFGYVGFGGEGAHNIPHIHHERGDALFDIAMFTRLQSQLKFESASGIESPPRSTKNAIHFVTKHFPFRYASTKTIVLVACKSCSSDGQSQLLDDLLEQNIVLHVLTLRKFKTSNGIKTVGADAHQLFDEHGAQVGHRSALIHPNDACAIVAQQTHGTVFSIKHGARIAASKIASTESSHCLECQCMVDGLRSHTVCRPCEPIEPVELGSYGMADSDEDLDLHQHANTPH